MRFQGAIFDIDGVLLDTPHEQAWRSAFEQLIAGPWRSIAAQTTYTPGAYTSAVYQAQVAGKPRNVGAQAALDYFQVPDPNGSRVRQYAELKQQLLMELAHSGGFHAYDDAIGFLLKVKAADIRIAAASASKNADEFLRQVALGPFCRAHNLHYPFVKPDSTLLDMFDANVNGCDFKHGKPDPEIFLTAARQLGYASDQCFVVEDAPAGIEAAKAGGMFGIGIARHNDTVLLQAAHADLVVTSLDAIDVDLLIHIA